MIATQLSSELDQRAGAFLAAAQFAADAGHLRGASLVGAAARIARTHECPASRATSPPSVT